MLSPAASQHSSRAPSAQITLDPPNVLDENPFATPQPKSLASSFRGSVRGASSALDVSGRGQGYFRSRRINASKIEKSWLGKKHPREKWHTIIPLIGIFLGICFTGLLCWQGINAVANFKYCLIYEDDFSSGMLDPAIWTQEVQVGGFGNGQFEQTTDTDENVFIKDGELWIKPTLQDENFINNNYTLNLTDQGICTSTSFWDCVATTNTTNGTIVNPVKSARINTLKGASIQYGRVQVTAKMPVGDWLWPAIWMLPVKETYGSWPASGEIDIAESRGNNFSYPLGGNDMVSGTLHWGPNPDEDAWYRTFEKKQAFHTTFAATYHTFGLEWSQKYLFTYIDSRLIQALYVPFNSPFWPQGKFPSSTPNGTQIIDPWSETGLPATPFDQPFYLILDVAVGSTNGWWTDGLVSKPWVDASPTAKRDFWNARSRWYPTWQDNGQMKVKSVKMWQQSGYQGCAA